MPSPKLHKIFAKCSFAVCRVGGLFYRRKSAEQTAFVFVRAAFRARSADIGAVGLGLPCSGQCWGACRERKNGGRSIAPPICIECGVKEKSRPLPKRSALFSAPSRRSGTANCSASWDWEGLTYYACIVHAYSVAHSGTAVKGFVVCLS